MKSSPNVTRVRDVTLYGRPVKAKILTKKTTFIQATNIANYVLCAVIGSNGTIDCVQVQACIHRICVKEYQSGILVS